MRLKSTLLTLAALLLAGALCACSSSDQGGSAEQSVLTPEMRNELDAFLGDSILEYGLPGAVMLVRDRASAVYRGAAGSSNLDDVAEERLLRQGPPPTGLWPETWPPFLDGETGAAIRGRTVLQGSRQESDDVPMATEKIFRIASLTKTFTATLTLMLVDDGRLGLDDTVRQWLGEVIPDAGATTVRMLLNHTGGLYDYARDSFFLLGVLLNPLKVWEPIELVDYALDHGSPPCHPGECWNYSSTGYILLGLITEAAGGASWEEQVTGRILTPLGLDNTYCPVGPVIPGDSCRGYLPLGGLTDVTDIDASPAWAAGDMASNVNDLIVWLPAFLDGALISPESREAMYDFTPTGIPGKSFGLGLDNNNGTLGHSGMVIGFQASMFKASGIYFIVLTNGNPSSYDSETNAAYAIARGAAEITGALP